MKGSGPRSDILYGFFFVVVLNLWYLLYSKISKFVIHFIDGDTEDLRDSL